jgi:hypothetical protein
MQYALHARCFWIFEYADGSPATVRMVEHASGVSVLEEFPDFKTRTKQELISWIEMNTNFKPSTDTEIINSNGKISACHVKVVDAWIKEYPDVVLPPDYKPWEEGKTFGTR